ncbi:hypothetical protein SAMN04487936_10445 [Halobacillus dabanensis]|uniref:Uncharacterized protein n=1 Tax=Halobacillus dabanensis TaxID=240302 RepID=A0A1I3TVG0_HALDA|nr:hypothetical protein [Halobacillus dabanensis]SFJ75244.1 hypothetical protein SAMN04487936_10445 [Halobacillus dabanensis]
MEKDTILLQQKIIHFKSELAKYKEKVKDYQENYHYALLEKLKKENAKLLEEQNALKKDRNVTSQELNKRIQGLEEQLAKAVKLKEEQVHETKLWKEKANQYQENYQDASQRVIVLRKESSYLQDQLKQKQEELKTRDGELQNLQQQSNKKAAEYQSCIHEYEEESVSLKSLINELEATIKEYKTIKQEQETQLEYINEGKKQLEQKNEELYQNVQRLKKLLSEAEEESNEQKALQTETIKNANEEINQLKQRNQKLTNTLDEWKEKQLTFQKQEKAWSEEKKALEQKQEDLKEEVKEKVNSLTILQETNEQLKRQNEKILGIYSEGDVEGESGDLLALLDQQMKNILGQTFEYEEQLDSKMVFMKTLEEKIEQLGEEILLIEKNGEDDSISDE